ncbi:hypothetical protein INF30_05680 [Lachnospiraceae bacterium DSM 108991]|uniref:Permuted papain-like amidase enzyme, YaeF/YiiX, C92 family n=1 Tax=Claveliimonas monacensis TaxID=2779351 RepID=A0ABR9RIG7_9FIRM|nr:YiiX/YebB-like N1pC/P60 family cysteine hydrolase [Claveliimonas monacensis]MBE5062748.1 hypothetical protein [Claveliimonas monacensis]
MMRKIKMLISLCLVFSFCLLGSLSVYAADVTPSVDEVFPEEQVEALQEKVSNLPVYSDKDENGEFHNIVTRATGRYPTRKGVILVTDDKYKGVVPTGHAAIVYSSNRVVESLENGVVTGANNWNTSKSTCYGVTVKGTTTSEDAAAADWCYNQLNKPYNWIWMDKERRDAFYCSHLVYAAFIDKYGINIDTDAFFSAIHPSEIVDSSNTTIIYKK